jgi:hypothetical protein
VKDEFVPMELGESVEEYHERIRSPGVAAIIAEGHELLLRRELAELRGEPWPMERSSTVSTHRHR